MLFLCFVRLWVSEVDASSSAVVVVSFFFLVAVARSSD